MCKVHSKERNMMGRHYILLPMEVNFRQLDTAMFGLQKCIAIQHLCHVLSELLQQCNTLGLAGASILKLSAFYSSLITSYC